MGVAVGKPDVLARTPDRRGRERHDFARGSMHPATSCIAAAGKHPLADGHANAGRRL